MSNENGTNSLEAKVRDIRRRTRRKYSSEEKIRIVLEGLKGKEMCSMVCAGRRRRYAAASVWIPPETCHRPRTLPQAQRP